MYYCITTLLFILSTLSSALYLDRHDRHQWTSRDMQRVAGCLDTRYSMWSWPGRVTYIFFEDSSDPAFTLAIATGYDEYYPKTLTNLLEAHHYRRTALSSTRDGDRPKLCGWWSAGTVRVDGRIHGSILWKYSDLRRRPHVPDFGNATSWDASSSAHIPPRLSTRPSDETLTTVRDMLFDNAPNADVFSHWNTALTMLSISLGMLAFQLALKCYTDWEARRSRADAESDIELDEIRTHGLSGSGMERMDTEAHKTRGVKTETTPSASSPIPSPTVSSIADPPPIYTLDGAGRSARERDFV